MNRWVLFPLSVLAIITIFWVFLGDSIIIEDFNLFIEAEEISYDIGFSININPLTGAITAILGIAIGIALLGFNILGSGLNDKSVHILTVGIMYTTIWGFLSAFSFKLFTDIPIFGLPIYIFLTILYAVGAVFEFSDEGGMD